MVPVLVTQYYKIAILMIPFDGKNENIFRINNDKKRLNKHSHHHQYFQAIL